MQHQAVTEKILASCFAVANDLGQGFLESVYQNALSIVFEESGLRFSVQAPIEVSYRGKLAGSFYADILVEDLVILEIKAVHALAKEHQAQILNYLKASRLPVGILVNFGSERLEYRRFDNRWIAPSSNTREPDHV